MNDVEIIWKREVVFAGLNEMFKSEEGEERVRDIMAEFLKGARGIFPFSPGDGKKYVVTLDLKEAKRIPDVPDGLQFRPLYIFDQDKLNPGRPFLLFCRPVWVKKFGLLMKLCPHEFTEHVTFIEEVKRFNLAQWPLGFVEKDYPSAA